MWLSPKIFAAWLTIGVLAINALAGGGTYFALQENRRSYQAWAEATGQNLTRVLEQYVGGVLGEVDFALRGIAEEIEHQEATGGIQRKDLNAFLERRLSRLPATSAFRVSDDAGRLRYGTRIDPAHPIDVSDRDHYIKARDAREPSLVISKPVLGRTDKEWVLILARRYHKADGTFGGVIFALLPLAHLIETFSGLDVGADGVVLLFDTERNFVARHPEPDGPGGSVGMKLGSPQIVKLIGERKFTATYRAQSSRDGTSRTYSYRQVFDYPLLVMVGLAEADYLAPWRRNALWAGGFGLLFLLIAALSAFLVYRSWNLRRLAGAALADQEAKHTAALQEERTKLLAAQQIAHMGNWDWDIVRGTLSWSDEVYRIFGIESAKFMATYEAFLDIVHPNDRDGIAQAVSDALYRGKPYAIDHRITLADGSERIVHERGEVQYDEAGKPVRMQGTVHDITERKRIEQRLADESENLKTLLETASDGIHVLDTEGNLTQFSRSFARMLGYTPEEAAALNLRDWEVQIPPDQLIPTLRALILKPATFETRHRRKDGSVFDVEINAKGITLHGRSYLYASARDITERKKSETEIRRLGDEMKMVLESAGEGIYGTDLEGRITFANAAAARLLGWKRDDLLGQFSHETFHHTHADETPYPRSECPIHLTAKDGESRRIEDDFFWRKDGTGFPVQYIVSARKVDERTVGTVVLFEDITDRKRTEAELQRSNAEFKQFSYAVSHDLQEPLRGVINFLTLLERRHKEALTEDGQEYIRFAVDGAKRMSDMIRDLLEFSRVQTKADEPKPVDTGELVQEAVGNLATAIAEAEARVTVADGLPMVMGRRAQLIRVFQNLIGNAIKYRAADRNPEVSVSVARSQGKWVFSIKDNGIGIDPQFHDRIFGVFQRLHTREEYGGTGIGLALVKRVVEQHGGEIWVESTPGDGSTFKFSLGKSGMQ